MAARRYISGYIANKAYDAKTDEEYQLIVMSEDNIEFIFEINKECFK